jgi:glutamyl-tRNA reductase
MNILLIGLSHKTAPVEIRERHALTPAMLRSVLAHFDATSPQALLEHVEEGIILSTCHRLEIYALVGNPGVARNSILDLLSHMCGVVPEVFSHYLYTCDNEAAVRHLMRVAAGLDSMVLGEAQILGQVGEAYEIALSQRAAGTVLSALFRAAIHAGKRARTETGIAVNSASVSSLAANLANQLLGDLPQRQVLLIGAGEMGTLAVKALVQRGVSNIVVANRTSSNAEQLARAWGGKAITLEQLPGALAETDIIITSTGAPHTILGRELLAPAMASRPERPFFVIDIAVPRNVDPDVAGIPGVHLCDIDDLQSQAQQNARDREAEVPRVEIIVDEEVKRFMQWFCSLEVASTIAELREQTERLRQRELARLFNRLQLDERERSLVATMSHRLVNTILHEPTLCLKKEAANGNGAVYNAAVRQLFSLDNVADQIRNEEQATIAQSK